jgi:para-nitrobenzyl esterase
MLVLAALLLVAPEAGLAADLDLHKPIRTDTGLLEGVANQQGDVVAFKGIPYAAPPIGKLRWREPQPPAKWEGVRKADKFGASCTQPTGPTPLPWSILGPGESDCSEDCLFLNVWTPAKSTEDKLAVLFFIHGGAFIKGSGSGTVFNGEGLARKGIIVVTVNYRLGFFDGLGHPLLTKESPHHVCGNYGMLDLIAALRWVHDNIAAFGGDPSAVTIAGQSSGSMAAHYLTTSPLAKGLFRGLIAVSFGYDFLLNRNSVGGVWQKEQEGLKFAAAKKANSLEELRAIPALDLLAQDPAIGRFTRGCLEGGVTTDGWAFPLVYPAALDKGLASDVPTLTGLTADDYGPPAKYSHTTLASFTSKVPKAFEEKKDAFLALYPATTDQEAREMAKQAQVEYQMASVFYWAKRRAKTAKTPVYTYFFPQVLPWPEHPEYGAFHSSDLVYEFNNLKRLDRPWTKDDWRVAEEVSSYWVNFVKTGNPNGANLPLWKPFDADGFSTMALGAESGPRPITAKERAGFYRDLFEKR